MATDSKLNLSLAGKDDLFTVEGQNLLYKGITGKSLSPEGRAEVQRKLDEHLAQQGTEEKSND